MRELPSTAVPAVATAKLPAIADARGKGVIEVVLPCGTSVRVDGRVEDRALRCVWMLCGRDDNV